VVDRRAARHPLDESVRAAVAAGVDRVQVRDRELSGKALLAHARELCDAARRGASDRGPSDHHRRVEIVVNRRIDIALCIDADGVHLGYDALAVDDARALWSRAAATGLLGVSTHDLDELRAAANAGADYAHLAPIFAPLSKPATSEPLGLAALEAAAAIALPVIAQGGIDTESAARAVRAGAAGVAVTGAILMADDPGCAAAALRRCLDESGAR